MAQTVLVVDDDPAQRRILEEVVRRDGYRVVSADGGEAAIDVLTGANGKDIACMILDLVMPGMDGMGVLEAIAPTHGDLPVIVLTAHGGVETVVKAMRAGTAARFNPQRLESDRPHRRDQPPAEKGERPTDL